jgi:hypothetical protein
MDEDRPIVRVSDDDRFAAMQILACIARPNRPASAGELMQQWYWARKRYRRDGLPDDLAVPIPDKDRIEAKLPALAKDLGNGLEAGRWFKEKWMAESDGVIVKAFGKSLRQQGAQRWNADHRADIKRGQGHATSRDDQTATAKQRIWIKRRPVAHMALAVGNERHKGLSDLEELVFNTAWVQASLEQAEAYADVAVRLRILKPGEPWRFIR